ncbi:MAG: EAL domain-containing protein, partial [Azovibrio sp.]|nr:EAL domain-containing protein [Azovibrio sp.]
MRQAKASGRNTLRCYQRAMSSDALARLQLENALRESLAQGHFQLHYQPLVECDSGRVVSVEALLRWPHPEQGMIAPARFIPLAEESGLIVPLGAWVLTEACRQARLWLDQGLALRIAVNLSSVQFKRGDLVATVREALARHALPGAYLELELTESILIQDEEETLETVRQLRELGIFLSIDDFGTGYSSLAYLRRLPVQKLKIDQSFVRQLTERHEDAAIVST